MGDVINQIKQVETKMLIFRWLLISVLALLLVSAAAIAGPLEDGVTAYKHGDYVTALTLWRSLAEQGDAKA